VRCPAAPARSAAPHAASIRVLAIAPVLIATLAGSAAVPRAAGRECIDHADYLHLGTALELAAGAEDIQRVGDLVYVAIGPLGLVIGSLAGGDLEILSVLDTPGAAHAVGVEGGTACIADGPGGLQVADVSDPENPVLLAGLATPT
jgi:hypothetical protein